MGVKPNGMFAECRFNARQLFLKNGAMQTLYLVFRARSIVSGNSNVFILRSIEGYLITHD
ncbi:MAG: hypothetical protein WBB29_08135 [Geitlerinemataceae cyanobacterium]